MKHFMWFVLLIMLWGQYPQVSEGSVVQFFVEQDEVASVDLTAPGSGLKSQIVDLYDPYFNKTKKYEAFRLSDVMMRGFAERWRAPEFSDVAFVALDGYQPVLGLEQIEEKPEAWLAFRDADRASGFEPFGEKHIDFSPYYLIWTGDHQRFTTGYPWPNQIIKIVLLRFQNRYPAVFPQKVRETSDVWQGFKLFRQRCLTCHAMDRQGGWLGPDLLMPKGIVSYRDDAFLKAYIHKPSDFRYSKMPDNEDLGSKELDQIITYLKHQEQHKTLSDAERQ